MTNKKIQEITDKLFYYFDECKEKDLIIGNFIGWLLNESNLVEAQVGKPDDYIEIGESPEKTLAKILIDLNDNYPGLDISLAELNYAQKYV